MAAEEKEKEQPENDKEGVAEGEQTEVEGSSSPPPKSRKKKIIFIAVFLILLLSTGGGILFYLKQQKTEEDKRKIEQKAAEKEIAYFDLDEILMNLNTGGKGQGFLKLKITLQVTGSKNLDAVKMYSPKIRDTFIIYLRELRPEDMQGSIALYKLKTEMLLRVNKIVYPAQINDILFKDVFVQ